MCTKTTVHPQQEMRSYGHKQDYEVERCITMTEGGGGRSIRASFHTVVKQQQRKRQSKDPNIQCFPPLPSGLATNQASMGHLWP